MTPVPISATPVAAYVQILGGTRRQRSLVREVEREVGPTAVAQIRIGRGRKTWLTVRVLAPRRAPQSASLDTQAEVYVQAALRRGKRYGFHDVVGRTIEYRYPSGRVVEQVRGQTFRPSPVIWLSPRDRRAYALEAARLAGTRVVALRPSHLWYASRLVVRAGRPPRAVRQISKLMLELTWTTVGYVEVQDRCGRPIFETGGWIHPALRCYVGFFSCPSVPGRRIPPIPSRWGAC